MTSSQKTLVGAFVVGGLLLFAVGLFWIGDRRQLFTESVELQTEFRNLSGLRNGAKVRVGGLDAGEVLAIQVPPGPESKFRVRFRVAQRFMPLLRDDSVATIQTEGLVGNRFLQVDAGSAAGRELQEGGMIQSRDPVELADLLQQAGATVRQIGEVVSEVREGVDAATAGVVDVTTKASRVVDTIGPQVERVTAASNRVMETVENLTAGVREGRGTLGKLFNDDAIYERLRDTTEQAQQITRNLENTTGDLRDIVADVRSRDLIGDFSQTVNNVRELSARAREMLGPSADGPAGAGMTGSLRQTLENANQAMESFAETGEALKRNWFFRGFFQNRGFYNLDAIPISDYREGKFGRERQSLREWIHEGDLFATKADGSEELSEAGKKRLDEAMAKLVEHSAGNPLIIEGYVAGGGPDEAHLRSRDRADLVRKHLIERFRLRPNYVGVMPMGAVESAAGRGERWGGVALVLYVPKGTTVASR